MVSSNPKYIAIYQALKHRIMKGDYEVGALFPTEPKLQQEFNASRITIRRSVQMLVDDGFLRKTQGIGTLVLSNKGSLQLGSLISFSAENQNKNLTSEILNSGISYQPSAIVLYRLGLSTGDSVAYQERIRYVDEEPIGFQRVYIPPFIDLTENDLRNQSGSLYELFEKQGHKVLDADETIAAVIADDALSKHLKLQPGSPLLYVQRTTRDQNERVVEYAEIFYRGDSYQYAVKLRAIN